MAAPETHPERELAPRPPGPGANLLCSALGCPSLSGGSRMGFWHPFLWREHPGQAGAAQIQTIQRPPSQCDTCEQCMCVCVCVSLLPPLSHGLAVSFSQEQYYWATDDTISAESRGPTGASRRVLQ